MWRNRVTHSRARVHFLLPILPIWLEIELFKIEISFRPFIFVLRSNFVLCTLSTVWDLNTRQQLSSIGLIYVIMRYKSEFYVFLSFSLFPRFALTSLNCSLVAGKQQHQHNNAIKMEKKEKKTNETECDEGMGKSERGRERNAFALLFNGVDGDHGGDVGGGGDCNSNAHLQKAVLWDFRCQAKAD